MKQLSWKRSVALGTAEDSQKLKRILLGHLASSGDCLYATAVARQIKTDYPGCHLTWAIGSMYRPILNGNPHVDEVWEIPLVNMGEIIDVWQRFEREAWERKKRGDFDEIFLTQFSPGKLHNYDGTIRSSTFRGYPKPITVPISPVLRLSPTEVENVRCFAQSHRLADKAHVILFECSPKSGQSFVTPDFAIEVTQNLIAKIPDVCVILSSNIPIHSTDERIIDGSVLSFRENAELTKYCSLLVGCSSGISWISTSDWAKALPMIQLLKANPDWFASFVYDYEYWGLPTDTIIEMTDCPAEQLLQCIVAIFTEGFDTARLVFHERVPLKFNSYGAIQYHLLNQGKYQEAALLLMHHIQRHGLHQQLLLRHFSEFIKYNLPFKMALKLKRKFLKK